MDDKTQQQAKSLANFVWQIAETLRGDFKQSEYGKVILPFVVLRRLDCILEPSKDAVLKAYESLPQGIDEQTRNMILYAAAICGPISRKAAQSSREIFSSTSSGASSTSTLEMARKR